MAEDTGRGLKGQEGPAEGEETRASPQGDGNPRAVTGSCSHSQPDPRSAWTPPGVEALPRPVLKAQPHQETRPAPRHPGTAASPGSPPVDHGSGRWARLCTQACLCSGASSWSQATRGCWGRGVSVLRCFPSLDTGARGGRGKLSDVGRVSSRGTAASPCR